MSTPILCSHGHYSCNVCEPQRKIKEALRAARTLTEIRKMTTHTERAQREASEIVQSYVGQETLECPDCGQRLAGADLVWPIPSVSEKVLPGEIMPCGECPDCDGLVYRKDHG